MYFWFGLVWFMVFNVNFNKKFRYFVAVSFIDGGNRSTRRNNRPVASHRQTVSHIVVLSTPRLERGPTHNFNGDSMHF
jgi:hypothetical protein